MGQETGRVHWMEIDEDRMIPINKGPRRRRHSEAEIERADARYEQDHLRWWKSIFDPYGIRIMGFTARDTAVVLDQNGESMKITGSFARSIQRGPST